METFPSLSIILLAYNEAESIGAVLMEHLEFGRAQLSDFEVIVIDDGSTDATAAEVNRVRADAPDEVRLISHPENLGMGGGMHTGIRAARKEYLVFNATDGQIPAAEIHKLLPLTAAAGIVLSTYESRRETWAREWISRGLRLYLRGIAGIRFQLQGLYLFPTKLAQTLEPRVTANTFFFSFALIELAVCGGASLASTRIALRPRQSGASKVLGVRRISRVARDALHFGVTKRSLIVRP